MTFAKRLGWLGGWLCASVLLAQCHSAEAPGASPLPPPTPVPPPAQQRLTPAGQQFSSQQPGPAAGSAAPTVALPPNVHVMPDHPVAPPVATAPPPVYADLAKAKQKADEDTRDFTDKYHHFTVFMDDLDRRFQLDIKSLGKDAAVEHAKQGITAAGFEVFQRKGPEGQVLDPYTVCAVGKSGERGCLSPDDPNPQASATPSVYFPNACPSKHLPRTPPVSLAKQGA